MGVLFVSGSIGTSHFQDLEGERDMEALKEVDGYVGTNGVVTCIGLYMHEQEVNLIDVREGCGMDEEE